MEPYILERGGAFGSDEKAEELVSQNFRPLYVMVDAFVENPAASIQLVYELFDEIGRQPGLTGKEFYHRVFQKLDLNGLPGGVMQMLGYRPALCWMLKELTGFNYQEIGYILNESKQAVKEHIFNTRQLLMTLPV